MSPDTVKLLEAMGHRLEALAAQGVAEAIVYDAKRGVLEGACDRRAADGAAVGW
jgi:gamma-glutamyltranspeptidase